jgi:hypothetical protein
MPGIDTMALDLAITKNDNKTFFYRIMPYSMKNGFFDLMHSLLMNNINGKLLDGIMAGHKLYIEKGTIVNGKTKLNTFIVKWINQL